jgi:hypothetical protein
MQQIDFNKNWMFYKDGDKRNAVEVRLPHDAQLAEKRSADMPMDSGYFPGGKYVYEKEFEWKEGTAAYLEFDGVYMHASVFVNDQEAAYQPYGYTNFVVPLHEHANAGINRIRVVADNSLFPSARWYTGAGIYRNVTLHKGVSEHIPPFGVRIKTLSIAPAEISVMVDTIAAEDCRVKTEISIDGVLVASGEGNDIKLPVPDAKLWSADDPNLYTAKVQLLKNGKSVDETCETFGIRMIEWDASYGIKINGKAELLRGGCVHHDNGLLGAAAHTDAEYRKVRLLKEAGFNALRSSHNMCSKAMLDACDMYGMYMMDEFADVWTQHKNKYDYASDFRDWYESDLTSIVTKDYNHPCVILYSIGNEVSETAFAEGVGYAQKMKKLIYEIDDTRPVTCGINLLLNGLASMGKGLYKDEGMAVDKKTQNKTSGSTFVNIIMSKMGGIINSVSKGKKFDRATKDVFQVLDICGYNYGSGRYSLDPKKYPKRITVGSETLPPFLYKNWRAVKKYPNLIGDFMWTAWDYIGEAGIGAAGYDGNGGLTKPYPALLSGAGVIEITGEYRPEVYWSQCVFGLRKEPYLAVNPLNRSGEKPAFGMWRNSDGRHSWSWPGYENRLTNVRVYADAYRVTLILNGRKIGTKKVKECKAIFKKVSYVPGELNAVAYDADGKVIGEDVLVSSKNAAKLVIIPEIKKAQIGALLYVNIYITDEDGNRVFGNEKKVTVEITGGKRLGLGSANPITEESYLESSFTTFNGMVQAIIMPDEKSAGIVIKASADGVEPCSIKLEAN